MARTYTMTPQARMQRKLAAQARGRRSRNKKIAIGVGAAAGLGAGAYLGGKYFYGQHLTKTYGIPPNLQKEFLKLAKRVKPRVAYEVLRNTYRW